METKNSRDYSCKDIEFLVICGFTLYSLKRDISDFTKYSPKFNAVYVTGLEADIAFARELVEPKSELVLQKAITNHMHGTMDDMLEPLKWVKGYIEMSGKGIQISVKDFGITETRKAIEVQDVEAVQKGLHRVNTNIVHYKSYLVEQGLSDELQAQLTAAEASIIADKQEQFEISTKRKAILQDNVGVLNALFAKIAEIHKVGKILFKGKDPVKLQEYTFQELLKKVRRISKATEEADKAAKA